MLVIGLSGGIASGKSTVARLLEERGAEVIDADRIGHAVLAPRGAARDEVLARFGPEVLGPDGGIDRARLGALVFADPVARRDLEAISHPHIYAEMERRLAQPHAEGAVVVIDAPLLVETGGARALGIRALAVVAATPEQQLDRAVARGTPPDRALAVIAAQASLSAKMAAADYVIDNRGALADLEAGVATFWADLTARFVNP
jgi:dephospho-CoA kinase